jgi:hypothetical protein
MLLLISLILVAAQDPSTSPTNPLAPAIAGKFECTRPDHKKRTCHAIEILKQIDGTRYTDTARIVLSPNGPVVFETTTQVTLKGNSVCSSLKHDDITTGRLWVGDRLLGTAEAKPILTRIAASMAELINVEVCATYERSGDGLVEKGTVGGVYRADADRPVEWVDPADGYKVAP